MHATDARLIDDVVDTERYPLVEAGADGPGVSRCRRRGADLARDAAACCRSFAEPCRALRQEGDEVAPLAYYESRSSTPTTSRRTRPARRPPGPHRHGARQRVRPVGPHPEPLRHPPALRQPRVPAVRRRLLRAAGCPRARRPAGRAVPQRHPAGPGAPVALRHQRVLGQPAHPGGRGRRGVRVLPRHPVGRSENFADVRAC